MHKKDNLINRIEEACSSTCTVLFYDACPPLHHKCTYKCRLISRGPFNQWEGWFPHPQEQLIAWLALNSCHWLRGQQGLGVCRHIWA
jgi:hypothetical protein